MTLSLAAQLVSNTSWLDAKETRAMVKDIVDKKDVCDCSYPLHLVPSRNSHGHRGEGTTQDQTLANPA